MDEFIKQVVQMAHKVDLAKAKRRDKVRFREGGAAILEKIRLARNDASLGDIFAVTFSDRVQAEYTRDGRAISPYARIEGESYGQLGPQFDIVSRRPQGHSHKPLSLSRTFNLAARSAGDRSTRHPAYEFQRNNNLRGIAGRYRIPGGYTAPEYEDLTSRKMTRAMNKLAGGRGNRHNWRLMATAESPDFLQRSWRRLLALNPVLQNVKVDVKNAHDLFNAHFGVTSGFNPDDINFFLEQRHVGDGLPAKQAREMPVHGARIARVEAVAASHMFWVASPKTVEKIEQRFKRRGIFK